MASENTLQLVFLMEGDGRMTINIDNPPADLTPEIIQASAAKIMPVLESKTGTHAVSLKSATVSTTNYNKLI